MFENIIAQAATGQLEADVLANRLAPSMLFFGPPASGKGSAAMELARALSCETADAPWNCACPSCARHRSLLHPDLAMLGPRAFAAEIAASRAAFLRDPAVPAGRSLFIRSLRKLQARFAPAVWEYEPRSGKSNPLSLLQSLEEELDELTLHLESETIDKGALEKITASLAGNAFKLEDEWISEAVPIAQIRKAAYWGRLTPAGKRKMLIIENADRMKDEARNSLLKLLEEPPSSLCLVLTVQRKETVLPTILSRLRPYRFVTRSADEEREIIRRIFRDPEAVAQNAATALVASYLGSFAPQPPEKLEPLAAFFVAAVARAAALAARSTGVASPVLNTLGSYCAPIAEASGLERTTEAKETITVLLSRSGNFEGRSFPRFLAIALDLVSRSLACGGPATIPCRQTWKNRLTQALAATAVWNQRPELALESLFSRLRDDLALHNGA